LLEDYIKPMGVSVRAVALHVPYSRLSEYGSASVLTFDADYCRSLHLWLNRLRLTT
jgi:hypothetical protein